MQAFEFQSATRNGFIKIPDEYARRMPPNVKVIILADEKSKSNKRTQFPDFSVDTAGFTFNREEANER